MRSYILTEKEHAQLSAYLKGGPKTANVSVIMTRSKQYHDKLDEDLRLVKKLLMDIGIYVDDDHTPLEVLEERRLDREELERNPMWKVWYVNEEGKKYYTLIQAETDEEAKKIFIKQRNGRYEPLKVELL